MTFHGTKVTKAALISALRQFVKAGEELDAIHSALFKGEGNDIGLTASIGAETCVSVIEKIKANSVITEGCAVEAIQYVVGNGANAGYLAAGLLNSIAHDRPLDLLHEPAWLDAYVQTVDMPDDPQLSS